MDIMIDILHGYNCQSLHSLQPFILPRIDRRAKLPTVQVRGQISKPLRPCKSLHPTAWEIPEVGIVHCHV